MAHLIGTGFTIGLDTVVGLEFDPAKPHTCCRLCGAVFQGPLDKTAKTAFELIVAEGERKVWSHNHASRNHSEREHELLRMSGRFCTPEAALKLASFGIISITDASHDEEIIQALYESKPIPTMDAQGG